MNVRYSKSFVKALDKLSGKVLESVLASIREVKSAENISQITDCKKLVGFNSIYRIRIGDYRSFFVFNVRIENGIVSFEYLVPRGEAYRKEMNDKLKKTDKK